MAHVRVLFNPGGTGANLMERCLAALETEVPSAGRQPFTRSKSNVANFVMLVRSSREVVLEYKTHLRDTCDPLRELHITAAPRTPTRKALHASAPRAPASPWPC